MGRGMAQTTECAPHRSSPLDGQPWSSTRGDNGNAAFRGKGEIQTGRLLIGARSPYVHIEAKGAEFMPWSFIYLFRNLCTYSD